MNKIKTLPGPRYILQGEGSGEHFRENYLLPAFEEAQNAGKDLIVNLDGAPYGYPTSFLEEAFGGLARKKGSTAVLDTINFECESEPILIYEIIHYIKNAKSTRVPPFEVPDSTCK